MQKYVASLIESPLFNHINAADFFSLLHELDATTKDHHKDQFVYLTGEPAGYIGIVLKGQIQIMQVDYDGRRNVMAAFGPYEVFGEAFACLGMKQMPVDILSVTDSTILFLKTDKLFSPDAANKNATLSPVYHQFIYNVMQLLAGKNLMQNQKLGIITHNTTQEKLLAFLSAQAKLHDAQEFDIPYNRQALADYLGVERSAMSAELSKLQKQGILETHKNHFKLFLDLEY